MMSYRSIPIVKSTALSPFQVVFGMKMRMPVDVSILQKEDMPGNVFTLFE